MDISFRAKKQIKQAVSLVWFLRQRGAAEPTPKFVRLGLTTCPITYRPELEIWVTLIDVAIGYRSEFELNLITVFATVVVKL